jgi:hypothetical protein
VGFTRAGRQVGQAGQVGRVATYLTPATHVLIAGLSTRAAAESAAHAGFTVTAIDAFADLDQHASVSTQAAAHLHARAARRVSVACDAVAYLSNFENHPAAVRTLAAGRELGNPPEALERVRHPMILTQALPGGIAAPDVLCAPTVLLAGHE